MCLDMSFFLRCQNITPPKPFLFLSIRFTEKGNLEVLLFTIQSKMRANNQKVYMPREGKLISDINKVMSVVSDERFRVKFP